MTSSHRTTAVTNSLPTPTPWVVEKNAYGTWFIYRAEATLTAPTGLKYRDLVAGGDGYHTLTEVNAALIVEAVNNYARLKSSNERMRKALEDIDEGYGPNHGSMFCRNRARSAFLAHDREETGGGE